MNLTKKEQSLLKDLQNEEKICAEKYHKAAEAACDPALKQMFARLEKAEQNHYDTVTGMLAGETPTLKPGQSQNAKKAQPEPQRAQVSRAEKKSDAYLLADVLATEKFVSGVYNTAVFEFSDPAARSALTAIQQQEQQHGKEISDYMTANGLYC